MQMLTEPLTAADRAQAKAEREAWDAMEKRIAELETALRRITPAYRAACAQLAGQSGDSEFWEDDAAILAECERLIAQ